jgi:hypothetical protein
VTLLGDAAERLPALSLEELLGAQLDACDFVSLFAVAFSAVSLVEGAAISQNSSGPDDRHRTFGHPGRVALVAGLGGDRVALSAVLHPRAVGGLRPKVVGDVVVAIHAAGAHLEVELVRYADLKRIMLESSFIDPVYHLLMAAEAVRSDPIGLGHKPLSVAVVEELMGLRMTVDAADLREGGMDQGGDPAVRQAPALPVAGETVLRARGGEPRKPGGKARAT